MMQSESNQLMYGQTVKYWKSLSFLPVDNKLYAESVRSKLVSYLKEKTDFKYLTSEEQDQLVMSTVRIIRTKLDAFPKALQKQAA